MLTAAALRTYTKNAKTVVALLAAAAAKLATLEATRPVTQADVTEMLTDPGLAAWRLSHEMDAAMRPERGVEVVEPGEAAAEVVEPGEAAAEVVELAAAEVVEPGEALFEGEPVPIGSWFWQRLAFDARRAFEALFNLPYDVRSVLEEVAEVADELAAGTSIEAPRSFVKRCVRIMESFASGEVVTLLTTDVTDDAPASRLAFLAAARARLRDDPGAREVLAEVRQLLDDVLDEADEGASEARGHSV